MAHLIAVILISLIHSNKITTKISCMTGWMVVDSAATGRVLLATAMGGSSGGCIDRT